jgi:hypothetical protein
MVTHTSNPGMLKGEIIAQLNVMVVERVFGGDPYLADEKTSVALNKRILEMGLEEAVLGEAGTSRITSLGKELNIWLLKALMGLICVFAVWEVLKDHGLISEKESSEIYDQLEDGEDPEVVLPHYVRLAYRRYFNPTNAVN